MSELCMHPAYDHLYVLLISKKGKLQLQTNIFPGIATFFLLNLLFCGSSYLKTNHQFFRCEISLPQASK